MFRITPLVAPAVLVLAACSSGAERPMPVPDESGSPSPSALGLDADLGWIVEASNDYMTGSIVICSDEDRLTNPDSEFPDMYLWQGGSMPDEWRPGDQWAMDSNGIRLLISTGKYQASRFDGEDGIGTGWETFGTLTLERDAHGVISSGSGTGKTTIIHANGDSERTSDTMTFSVRAAKEPAWCNIPVEP